MGERFKCSFRGVCAKGAEFEMEVYDQKIIKDIKFIGGCQGGLATIAKLLDNKSVEEVVAALDGIHCGSKGTSCGAEFANYLKMFM